MNLCLCPFQKKLKMKTFKYFISAISLFSVCVSVFFSMNICLSATTTPNSPLATYTQHCSSCLFVFNMAMSYRCWSQRARTIDFCFWRDLLLFCTGNCITKKLGSDFFFGWRSFLVDVAVSCSRSARHWEPLARTLTRDSRSRAPHSGSLSFRRKFTPILGHGTSPEAACCLDSLFSNRFF